MNDLIEDIKKRMTALGYENLEELYSPDHDMKSLKELKRRLMDEAKNLRDLKKEKTRATKELRNILVKFTKLYRKDFYIYNGQFAIPGPISEESLKGKFIVSIKEEFLPTIKEILFPDNENTLLFISDVSEVKNVIDNFLDQKDLVLPTCVERGFITKIAGDKYEFIIKSIHDEFEMIQDERDDFIPCIIEENDPEVISLKKIFKIQYKDFPPIEGNIQLFPFFTEAERPYIEFMSKEFDNGEKMKLYFARFHLDYILFDIYFKIYYF